MAESGKSTVVSIKATTIAGQKRKTDVIEVTQEADREKKKNRRSINKKGKR